MLFFSNRFWVRGCLLALLLAGLAGCQAGGGAAAGEKQRHSFWPAAPRSPQIQFLTSYDSSTIFRPERGQFDELLYGKETGQTTEIGKPYGVAMAAGRIYVCDTGMNVVFVVDFPQKQVRLLGAKGTGKMTKPVDVAVASDGAIYVADSARGAIVVFDAQERHVTTFGHERFKPVSLAVHGQSLYVADMLSHKVEILDRQSGEVRGQIGEPGIAPGQLRGPLGLDVDQEGNVYVSDILNYRLQKFTPEGKLVFAVGKQGSYPGAFIRPKHLAVDQQGRIYVVDAAFQNVQVFDNAGKVTLAFGGAGSEPGNMDLPAGVAVYEGDLQPFAHLIHPAFEAQRLLVVTNQFGPYKVALYAMGQLRAGHNVSELGPGRLRPSPAAVAADSFPSTQPADKP